MAITITSIKRLQINAAKLMQSGSTTYRIAFYSQSMVKIYLADVQSSNLKHQSKSEFT